MTVSAAARRPYTSVCVLADDLNDPVNQAPGSATTLSGPFPKDANVKSNNGPMSPQDLVALLTEMVISLEAVVVTSIVGLL